MNVGQHAANQPDRPAVVMAGTGDVVTYAELDARSTQLVRLLRGAGLAPGDHVAVLLENHPRYLEVAVAALRSGLYLTPVNSHLPAAEAAYIVDDCGAVALVSSAALGAVAADVAAAVPRLRVRLAVDGPVAGFDPYETALAAWPAGPLDDEPLGEMMLYSSGTTGRPKGIVRPLSGGDFAAGTRLSASLLPLFGFGPDTVYLSPAPLYHSAPIGFTTSVLAGGGTVVVMEHFDPAACLAAIEHHRVTGGQWVPTMFSRLLRLPDDVRAGADVSSLTVAVHAAAPCPVEIKRRMIEWWGPILHEYYAGSESTGLTHITSDVWLEHPGSVGRPASGAVHVVGPDGAELGAGEVGAIYFEGGSPFEYHGDPAKTAAARHPAGWATIGDLGYVDDDGFLYLTDRQAFMIISGGVNIYPQEAENVLAAHPAVADVAVIGVPDDDLGEAVRAVVQPVEGVAANADLAAELLAYTRHRLAHYKCPRAVDFDPDLPRLPTGKLAKGRLRSRYWPPPTSPT